MPKFESYQTTKLRAKIGSWSFYDAYNEVGSYLIKVSEPLTISGYGDIRDEIDEINQRAKFNKSIKVPKQLKLKTCTFDSKTSRIILAYPPNSSIQTVAEVLNKNSEPDFKHSLWHLAMTLIQADEWGDFGLADIWVDKHAKWWPDYLQLSHLLTRFSPDSINTKKSIKKFFKKQHIKTPKKFRKHLSAMLDKNDIYFGYFEFKQNKSSSEYIKRLYSSLLFKHRVKNKNKTSTTAKENPYTNLSFSEKTEHMKLMEMYLNTEPSYPHQMHNGYFWEPVTVQISEEFRTGPNVTAPDTTIRIETPYGLIIQLADYQCHIALRNNKNSISLPSIDYFDSEGNPLKADSPIKAQGQFTGTITEIHQDGTFLVDLGIQKVKYEDLE